MTVALGRIASRTLLACALLSPVALPTQARAEGTATTKAERAAADQRARELFVQGDAAYAEGRYEQALTAFDEAHRLSARPQLFYNISNALERLARYEEAAVALEKYLAGGKVKDRDVIQKRLENLQKRAADQRAEREKAANEEALAAKEREEAEQKRRDAERTQREAPPPREEPSSVVPWVLVVGGAAVFATGAVFGGMTLAARGDASDGCADGGGGHLCSAEARSALDREKTFGVVADVGMVTGLVLSGVGVTWLLTRGSSGRASAPASAQVGVRGFANGGGLQLGGTF